MGIEVAGAALQPIATQGLSYRGRNRLEERPCVAKGAQSTPGNLENHTAIGAVIGAWCS
jgi:hypothetical protein